MSWHVNFGHHGDMASLGVCYDLAGFLLSVESTVWDMVIEIGIGTDGGAATL